MSKLNNLLFGVLAALPMLAQATVISGDIDTSFGEHGFSLVHPTADWPDSNIAQWQAAPTRPGAVASSLTHRWFYQPVINSGSFNSPSFYALYSFTAAASGGADTSVHPNGHALIEEGEQPGGITTTWGYYDGLVISIQTDSDDVSRLVALDDRARVVRRADKPFANTESPGRGEVHLASGMIVVETENPTVPTEDGDIFNGYRSFTIQVFSPDFELLHSFSVGKDGRDLQAIRVIQVDPGRVVIQVSEAPDKRSAVDGVWDFVAFNYDGSIDTSWGTNGVFVPPTEVEDAYRDLNAFRTKARPGGGFFLLTRVNVEEATTRLHAYDSSGQLDSSYGEAGEARLVDFANPDLSRFTMLSDGSFLVLRGVNFTSDDRTIAYSKLLPSGLGRDAAFSDDGDLYIRFVDSGTDDSGASRGRICSYDIGQFTMDSEGRIIAAMRGQAPETERPANTHAQAACMLRFDPEVDSKADASALAVSPVAANPYEEATSELMTIQGLGPNTRALAAVVDGKMSLNGADFSKHSAWVSNGDTIRLRGTASGVAQETRTTKLVIGDSFLGNGVLASRSGYGVTSDFEVTTNEVDATPDPFTITPVRDAARNTLITSSSFTVTGIETPVPISVAGGGEYSINGRGFTEHEGTASSGDSIRVRVSSSGFYSDTVSTTLNIADQTAEFLVTTESEPNQNGGDNGDNGDNGGGAPTPQDPQQGGGGSGPAGLWLLGLGLMTIVARRQIGIGLRESPGL